MAYSTSNPPVLQSKAPLTGAGQKWVYSSADPMATVDGAGYITNGYQLGMRVGDTVDVNDTTNGINSTHRVITVNATTGAVDLGNGTTIGTATNSD